MKLAETILKDIACRRHNATVFVAPFISTDHTIILQLIVVRRHKSLTSTSHYPENTNSNFLQKFKELNANTNKILHSWQWHFDKERLLSFSEIIISFGHICRMSRTRLAQTVMLGITAGTRSRGRPPRRWSDDIEKSCNCTLSEAVRLTENGQTWRETVDVITRLNDSHKLWE